MGVVSAVGVEAVTLGAVGGVSSMVMTKEPLVDQLNDSSRSITYRV